MSNIVPGAIWQPIDVGDRDVRAKGRGAVAHVAVAESAHLVPGGPVATRGADWHFYLPRETTPAGRFYQFIDLDLQCWASGGGNYSMPAWESQGGVHDAEHEPWSDNQLEAGALIYAYLMESEGAPNRLMTSSLSTERGLGWHKLGVRPWVVPGGEVWSSSYGKICPGQAKIDGMATMLARAVELRHGSPSPAPKPIKPTRPTAPPRLSWPFGRGQYVGDIKGPAASHGGYYASERAFVENCQQWLIYHGCVPGIDDWHSGWADGRFERPYSTDATVRWHQRFYPHQPYMDQIWSDDYERLARP